MIRIVWTGIMICLFVGIFYLGNQIFGKPGEMKMNLRETGSRVEEKIVGLAENAARIAVGKIHNVVKQTIQKNETPPVEKPEPKKAQEKTIPVNKPVSLASAKPAAGLFETALNLDERKKESAVVSPRAAVDPQMVSQPGLKMTQKKDVPSESESPHKAEETEPSFDMNRLNRIRDLHVKALEILEWN